MVVRPADASTTSAVPAENPLAAVMPSQNSPKTPSRSRFRQSRLRYRLLGKLWPFTRRRERTTVGSVGRAVADSVPCRGVGASDRVAAVQATDKPILTAVGPAVASVAACFAISEEGAISSTSASSGCKNPLSLRRELPESWWVSKAACKCLFDACRAVPPAEGRRGRMHVCRVRRRMQP